MYVVGLHVPVTFTPKNTPPELALVTERGDSSIAAEPAADIML